MKFDVTPLSKCYIGPDTFEYYVRVRAVGYKTITFKKKPSAAQLVKAIRAAKRSLK
jgi:hypothetical protein